jgi:RNA polymerase sigma factor (sigma-70 family)
MTALTPGSSLLTRASLFSRLRDGGDALAWEQFATRYGKLVRDFAAHAGLGAADADDIAQEVMLGFAKQAADFRYDPSRGRFKTWLLTLARRRIADHWRRHYRQEAGSQAAALPEMPAEPELERLWDVEWESFLLEQALERVRLRVSNRQFLLWDLAVRQEMPVADICRSLQTHAPAVYLARHRVSRMLRQEVRALAKEEPGPPS